MSTPHELTAPQFTERLLPIFLSVAERLNATGKYPVQPNPAHFFPQWRRLMELGVARTWEIPGAVLGALFVPNLFTGEAEALVCFWFALPNTRGTLELMDFAEHAARDAGCVRLKSAAFGVLRGDAMERLYQSLDFVPVETGFSKTL
jgi:hypothetical protein